MDTLRLVWRTTKAGSLERLKLQEEPLAPPGPGEARIRVEAIGLNFADIFACQGLYSATPSGSFVPGLECAGVVESIGSEAESRSEVRPGDRVIALTRFGAYATALNVDTQYLHRVPDDWTMEQAAAWAVQGLTAWHGLVALGAVERNDVVLVQSAAGGVGLLALDIVGAVGASPIAVVGQGDKRDFLIRQRGIEPSSVIVRHAGSFGAQLDAAIAALGADGLDCVLDAVLGPTFRPAFERLRPEGRYVLYGAADFMSHASRPDYLALGWRYLRRPRLDPLAMISANRSVMAFNLIWLWERAERLPEAYASLARLLPRPPHIGARFPFDRALEAMRLLQSGTTIGKVVLSVASST
ncbi:MAG TPA: zinc-binding dehydrogenase [Steroidobacteraceae bacterium]|nr:zinc-binding dehydrogenase [Steroidobacteraceae bacterium]